MALLCLGSVGGSGGLLEFVIKSGCDNSYFVILCIIGNFLYQWPDGFFVHSYVLCPVFFLP